MGAQDLEKAAQLAGVWAPWVFLVATRVGVAMTAMPAPFGSVAPARIRAALTFVVAAAIAVGHGDSVPLGGPAEYGLLAAAWGEVMIGAVIGLTVRVTMAAAEIAGTISGFTMGLGFANSVDPSYGESSNPPARILAAVSTVIFLVFQGHHAVFRALSGSLDAAPVGHVVSIIGSEGAITLGTRMLARGLQIAAPVLGTMLIVQSGTALASRSAPKVPLMYLSFAITTGAGVVTLFVAAPSLAAAIVVEVRNLPALLAQMLGGAV